MAKLNIIIVLFLLLIVSESKSEQLASWITYSKSDSTNYGVYHFRKSYEITDVPARLMLRVSADNKYNLFINGERVCYGPAKGDLKTYKYDIVDIAPFLKKRLNQFAVLVYNGGKDKPLAFMTVRTAFYMQSEDSVFNFRTDKSWKVFKNKAYKLLGYKKILQPAWFYGFYASGGGDDLNMKKYPVGWEMPNFDDKHWRNAIELDSVAGSKWCLYPSNIPFMDNHTVLPIKIRESVNANGVEELPGNGHKIIVPARTKSSILIDFEDMTFGYPEITLNKGKGSVLKIKYAESLYDSINSKAAHRDSIAGKKMFGTWDIFRPDGSMQSTFRPLWIRSFRYMKLEIETRSEPLEILKISNEYAGYPYPKTSTFVCDDKQLNTIFDMSLRTFKLCSADTYFDTPYYEQLNYGGDNLPIGAISFYNSTDDRLYKEMLRLYPQSENQKTGLFKSAYPSRFDFDMGTWSLAWVQSLDDYYDMRGDSVFVKQFVGNIEKVLGYFHQHIKEPSMLLEHVQTKNFIDWSEKAGSIPHKDSNEEFHQSVLLTLYYTYTLDCAVNLYTNIGEIGKAINWKVLSSKIKKAVYEKYWDSNARLIKEYPGKNEFTQHTNILAILCDVVPVDQQNELLKKILTYDKFDEKGSSYFSFFLFKAMEKTQQEELIHTNLNFWNQFISKGLHTCGESGFASMDRSDCHAWSAHPAYFFINSICGIKPAEVGFKSVLIEPHLGKLTNVTATMPHLLGEIRVEYNVKNDILGATIFLPANLDGVWKYKGYTTKLNHGMNRINYSGQ